MSIKKHTDRLIELIIEIIKWRKSDSKEKFYLSDEFEFIRKEIMAELIYNPGELIYYKDVNELKAAQTAIDILWDTIDAREILDEITSGEHTWFMVNVMGDYSDRLKLLKPIFININPENSQFKTYFKEAMNSWLFGLNNAAIILCCSIIEDLLKNSLCKEDPKYVYDFGNGRTGPRQKSLDVLIQNAKKIGLLNNRLSKMAFGIKNLRNSVVHKLETISSEFTLDAIKNTKTITETILSTAPNTQSTGRENLVA